MLLRICSAQSRADKAICVLAIRFSIRLSFRLGSVAVLRVLDAFPLLTHSVLPGAAPRRLALRAHGEHTPHTQEKTTRKSFCIFSVHKRKAHIVTRFVADRKQVCTASSAEGHLLPGTAHYLRMHVPSTNLPTVRDVRYEGTIWCYIDAQY